MWPSLSQKPQNNENNGRNNSVRSGSRVKGIPTVSTKSFNNFCPINFLNLVSFCISRGSHRNFPLIIFPVFFNFLIATYNLGNSTPTPSYYFF